MRPRIPKESPVFDEIGRWTRTWIMYFESLYDLSVAEAVRLAAAQQGEPGLSTSVFPYRADLTSTTAADPGKGKVRWNNATQHSATALYFDWLTTGGFDVTGLMALMDAPDVIILQDMDLALNHQTWELTGPVVMMADWFQVPVSFVSSSGAGVFTHNQPISVLVPSGGGGGGGGGGGVTAVTGTAPIASSGGTTPDISIVAFTGDSGSGGAKGAVPAPASGDAAAGKLLGAGGGWVTGGAGTVTHTGGALTADLPVFGAGSADIKVGTKTGNTDKVVTNTGTNVSGNTVQWDANGNLVDAGTTPGGSGTVTHTGGALTADQPMFGAGTADSKVGTKSGNTNKVVTNTGTNVTGNTVKWDANGNLIDAGSAPGGSGTVTSVALTVPAEFSVSGSPVTTSGTLAVSKATQSANAVFAGPTTGSAAAPTFRAVVPADLPLASSSAFGAVKVDGTTITAASGVISAAGGSSGALILLEQHTANNTSVNMDFTAFISGSYDEYVIELVNVVPATNNVIISIRMSVSGTFDTAANYSAVGSYLYSGGTGVALAEDSASQIKLWDGAANTATFGFCGSYRLFSPGSSSLYKVLIGQGFAFSGSAAKIFGSHVWGVYRSTSAVDGVRVFSSSGNLSSGIVRIYGLAK